MQRFEAPANRFAAGHRGIDFGIPFGTEVRSSGEGRVTFAGRVAHDGLFVTVAHGQEVRTTYSFLSEITVSQGDRVASGQILGRSGSGHPDGAMPGLHFAVRIRDEYVDPEAFLFGVRGEITLVPVQEVEAAPAGIVAPKAPTTRTAPSTDEEAGTVGGAFIRLGSRIARTLDRQPARADVGCTNAADVRAPRIPTPEQLRRGAKAPRAPNENLVVAVAGVGSSTVRGPGGRIRANAALYEADLGTLGFAPGSVFYFSYRGIEQRPEAGPYRLHAPYSRNDTLLPIELAARKLDRQLQVIHRLYPDRKVGLVAHSQGGLIAQYFLERLYRPGPGQAVVDHFVSIATPHRGADLAQLHRTLSDTASGRVGLAALDTFATLTGLPPPTSPPVSQMAEGSRFLQQLAREWRPSPIKTTTIAATFDLVVPSPRTRLDGATHYTADLPFPTSASALWAHGRLAQAESTKQILYNAPR